jgi:hypothetical protein
MFQSDKQRTAVYREQLQRHSDGTEKLLSYSIQRIDLLVISVSGAGIFACLEIMKYIRHEALERGMVLFKITGVLFVLAIVFNFLGKWAAYQSCEHMKRSVDLDIRQIDYDVDTSVESKRHDRLYVRYRNAMAFTNVISTGSLLMGLILMIVFIWIIF